MSPLWSTADIQAQKSYLHITPGKLSDKHKVKLTQNLKHCSKLDTLAMAEIIGDWLKNKLGSVEPVNNFV